MYFKVKILSDVFCQKFKQLRIFCIMQTVKHYVFLGFSTYSYNIIITIRVRSLYCNFKRLSAYIKVNFIFTFNCWI